MRHWSEVVALRFLESRGYRHVATNVIVARVELDLIVRDASNVVVVEVRQRASNAFGGAAESLTRAKRLRLRRGASAWAAREGYRGAIRIDAVLLTGTQTTYAIDHFENVA